MTVHLLAADWSWPHAAALVAVCLGAPAAWASTGAAPAPSAGFELYDRNRDGRVTPDEFRAQGGDEKAFRAADKNGDNRLSAQEFAQASRHPAKGPRFVPDAWITAEVKAQLQRDLVPEASVDVRTHKGMVLLSGWVRERREILRAERIVRGVHGVSLVSNDLRVRR